MKNYKDASIPEHYHCSVAVKGIPGLRELTVCKIEGRWAVEDDWSEFDGAMVKSFKKRENAIRYAFGFLFKKYPTAEMIYGQIPKEIEREMEEKYAKENKINNENTGT